MSYNSVYRPDALPRMTLFETTVHIWVARGVSTLLWCLVLILSKISLSLSIHILVHVPNTTFTLNGLFGPSQPIQGRKQSSSFSCNGNVMSFSQWVS